MVTLIYGENTANQMDAFEKKKCFFYKTLDSILYKALLHNINIDDFINFKRKLIHLDDARRTDSDITWTVLHPF